MRTITLILLLAAVAYPQAGMVESHGFGVGDGSQVTFSGTLTDLPVKARSVMVRCAMVAGRDRQADGTIQGSGISGTVNYSTGAISVTFDAPPKKGSYVVAFWRKNLGD